MFPPNLNKILGLLTVRYSWLGHLAVLTLLLALQIGDKHRVTTPVNWNKGDDVIVHPGVTNDEAKTLFPGFTTHLVSAI